MVTASALILALAASEIPIAAHAETPSVFRITSTVTYASNPERPHALDAIYSAATRACLWVGIEDARGRRGTTIYRNGDALSEWDPKTSKSRELQAEERSAWMRSLELRRAAFRWPDGFVWATTDGDRRAQMPGLGTLQAHFAQPADPRPQEIAAIDPTGAVVEKIKLVAWREIDGRSWPARLELWQADALVWTETVDAIDATSRWIDSAFLPPDRREGSSAPASPSAIQERDLPAYCGRRFPLDVGNDWNAALEAEARERAVWDKRLRELGMELEQRVTFVLSAKAQPEAFILRLSKVPATIPDGFARTETHKGFAVPLATLSDVTVEKVGELRARARVGTVTEPALLRLQFGERPPQHLLLVLPIAASR